MAKTNEGEVDGVVNGKTLVPPHNLHLARKMNVVKCRVDLYKIPPKCIKFEPTATHLYVDTLKYTKKFVLNIPYPEGVTVDTNVEATFDSGVLKCDFPIVNDPQKPADHDEVVAAREHVKELRKNGIPIPEDLVEAAKLAKVKEQPLKEEETPASTPKKTKKVLSNKDKRQKEKAKRIRDNEGEDEDPTEKRKKKKAKKELDGSKKKNKAFMDDTSAALKVADMVNDKQDKELQDKYDKEYEKLSFETRRKIETREKKQRMKAQRQEEVDKAIDKFPKKEKTKKKTTKVSFAK